MDLLRNRQRYGMPDSSALAKQGFRNASRICKLSDCQRPVHQLDDKTFSEYCSWNHMRIGAEKFGACAVCKIRPRYNDNGHIHLFCGRRCARISADTPQDTSTRGHISALGSALVHSLSRATCVLKSCNKLVFVAENGVPSRFCSNGHRRAGTLLFEPCLHCDEYPAQPDSPFCSWNCTLAVKSKGPVLLKLPDSHTRYENVKALFESTWKHPTACPVVKEVYMIFVAHHLEIMYKRYQQVIQARGKFKDGRGNEHQRWHGTKRECQIGLTSTEPCKSASCSLCRIISVSFAIDMSGSNPNTTIGRFGKGIYTSATSSKAADETYSRGASMLILCKVVVGRSQVLDKDAPDMTRPGKGCDSVTGRPGQVLNYDECVVYNNEAIRPECQFRSQT